MVGAITLPERAPMEAVDVEDMSRVAPGAVSLPALDTHAKMVNVMSSSVVGLQVRLIGTTFVTVYLSVESLVPEAKEAKAHAKETKA